MCLKNLEITYYRLCLNHYLRAPFLSWDAILSMTKVELISDSDVYLFFEKSMRGEVSYISMRYSNNIYKYLKSYDPKQQSKHIIYLKILI